MEKKKLAAFIITFERSEIIVGTINAIFNQTLPPEKILVVDNSISLKTQDVIQGLKNPKIEYYRVGYNGGASGGAHFGLKILAAQDFDHIVWCDDDDPPLTNDTFEVLSAFLDQHPECAVTATTGNIFDRRKAELKRFSTEQLQRVDTLEVDASAGGSFIMTRKEVALQGVLPDHDLFFGFEDLDFCLAVKRAGFRIMVPAALFYRYRQAVGNLDYVHKPKLKPNYAYEKMWRYYYSNRNLIYIMLYKEKLYLGALVVASKAFAKAVAYLFTVNIKYGIKYFWLMTKAMMDGVAKRLGRANL